MFYVTSILITSSAMFILPQNEVEGTGETEIRQSEVLAVGEACQTITQPTSGLKQGSFALSAIVSRSDLALAIIG